MLDLSRQRLEDETLRLLLELAGEADVLRWRDRMLAGGKIHLTENRAVLHTALRLPESRSLVVECEDVVPMVHRELRRMVERVAAIRGGDGTGAAGQHFRSEEPTH